MYFLLFYLRVKEKEHIMILKCTYFTNWFHKKTKQNKPHTQLKYLLALSKNLMGH